jgi:hypothetical protein
MVDIEEAQIIKAYVLFVVIIILIFGCGTKGGLMNMISNPFDTITKFGSEAVVIVVTAYLSMELLLEASIRVDAGFFDSANVSTNDKVGAGFMFFVGAFLACVTVSMILSHCASCILVIADAKPVQFAIPFDQGHHVTWSSMFGKRRKKKGKKRGRKKRKLMED